MSDIPLSSDPILQTLVSDGDLFFPVSTIQYRGDLWLVPKWIVNDAEGWQAPVRIIGLSPFQVQVLRGKIGHPADFSLPAAIPKFVLDDLFQGKSIAGWPFQIEENPPIRFPIQSVTR